MKKSKPLAKFTALIVVIILSSCHVFSQSIATSQGEFRLIPVEDLVDATAAKSAKRTAELAIPALISDSKKSRSNKRSFATRN